MYKGEKYFTWNSAVKQIAWMAIKNKSCLLLVAVTTKICLPVTISGIQWWISKSSNIPKCIYFLKKYFRQLLLFHGYFFKIYASKTATIQSKWRLAVILSFRYFFLFFPSMLKEYLNWRNLGRHVTIFTTSAILTFSTLWL